MPTLPDTSPSQALVWLRRDLRPGEHAVLYDALRRSDQVYCLSAAHGRLLPRLRLRPQAKARRARQPLHRTALGLFCPAQRIARSNHRLELLYRRWQKMPTGQHGALREQGQQLRQRLDALQPSPTR